MTKTNKYTMGRQAQVPVELSLPGGASSFDLAGGSLNPADDLRVDRADYTILQQWQPISIQAGALATADGSNVRSTIDVLDQTVESNLAALRREQSRHFVTNGDALIAECTTTAASTTVNLSTTGYGFDAIERGWLRVGQTIDIGTTANEVSVAADRNITNVSESTTDPEIVISGANVTTAAGDFVSIANARSGATSFEPNGLRNTVGSSTSVLGTLNPSSVPEWKPAHVDTTTTIPTLDLLLKLQRKVYQKSGAFPSYVTTSPAVAADLYSQYQQQVRFRTDKDTAAGDAHGFEWNGMAIAVDPDIPNRELYMLTLEDFFVVTGGRFSKPTWASDIQGTNKGLGWVQGTTRFDDALVYFCNLAMKRRNRCASAIGLTSVSV